MKKQKLKLDELKVQSFVTDFEKEKGQTQEVNGGGTYPNICVVTIVTLACPVYTTTKTILTTTTKSYAGCPTDTTNTIGTIETIGTGPIIIN
jgi:hypothetical protein